MMNTGILEGLIPLFGGIYGTLLGFNRIGSGHSNPRITMVLAQLRWLGPLVIVFGLWLMWQAIVDKKPNVEEIVLGMRQKVTLPVNIDETTRLDAFEYEGRHIIYQMTITKPPPTAAEIDSLMSVMRQRLISQECRSEKFQRLLAQDIALKFVYTINSMRYPAIVVSKEICGRS